MSGHPSTLTASKQEQATKALARSEIYLFLARGFSYPQLPLTEPHHRAQQAHDGDEATQGHSWSLRVT